MDDEDELCHTGRAQASPAWAIAWLEAPLATAVKHGEATRGSLAVDRTAETD